jgi:hypothetical protein
MGHCLYVTDYWDTVYVTIKLLGHPVYVTDYWDTLYMLQLDYWGELMRLDGMERWSDKPTSQLSLILAWLRLGMVIGLDRYIITNLQ